MERKCDSSQDSRVIKFDQAYTECKTHNMWKELEVFSRNDEKENNITTRSKSVMFTDEKKSTPKESCIFTLEKEGKS